MPDDEILDGVLGCTLCPHQWQVPLCDNGDTDDQVFEHLLDRHDLGDLAAIEHLNRIIAAP